ncbi:MAG: formamidopyrimidine-DNA glycosylase [Dehalococcoidaceae bacterium]|nr:formamidopyrimidine-DNA glycosylase [Dehalococcoidaceae bacterium]
MPELPEVETIVKDLFSNVINKKITTLKVFPGSERLFLQHTPVYFKKRLMNNTINHLSRHGKYIIFHLSEKKFLIMHLRMTGSMSISNRKDQQLRYEKIRIIFSDNTAISFMDIRKFGTIDVVDSLDILRTKLGPDAISDEFNVEFLANQLKRKQSSIKAALLDQKIAAGIGNIYADEACWDAKISPLAPAASLKKKQILQLCSSIKIVLNNSISNRGTSINNYMDLEGNQGYHQTKVAVYGRNGEPCIRCKTLIIKIRIAGRGTFYCPKCQNE